MRALIVPDSLAADIATRNNAARALVPVRDVRGRLVLGADLLTDCGPGQTWEDFADLLTVLVVEDVELPPPPTGSV